MKLIPIKLAVSSLQVVCCKHRFRPKINLFSIFLAIMYPDSKIFVMFMTNSDFARLNRSLLTDAVSSYPNVHLKYLNLQEFSKNSPVEDFLKTDKLAKSKYRLSHTSDILRYLILHKFGGTYFDLDVIVMKRMNLTNYACLQQDELVACGILNFDNQHGRMLTKLLIE